MGDIWFQCCSCVFGTNSPKKAIQHINDTDHPLIEEKQ